MKIWYLQITEKLLFWSFWKLEIRSFLGPKKLIERWYLLITEKALFWTFQWLKIRSFFESRSWWKDDIYWLLRSSCFELFGDGKYGLFLSQEVDEKMIFTWSFWAFYDILGPGKYVFSHSVCVSPLVILIGCMIFLLPFRNVRMIFWNEIKEMISTLSFLWPLI